uniref:Uncharacterized protein n=1 Tax=Lotus japonicus TaxID=34305 RepID=I3SCU7_LOTJA|nr:unknown [Lotus japonicus]
MWVTAIRVCLRFLPQLLRRRSRQRRRRSCWNPSGKLLAPSHCLVPSLCPIEFCFLLLSLRERLL